MKELSPAQTEYAIKAYIGAKPKFHKGIYGSKHDYYTCGHCGAQTKCGVVDNHCFNCGYRILWDNPRCLIDYHN